MAALAVPLIEGVAARVLVALGVGVAAGAAGEAAKEQARKRQEEADKTKSAPIALTEATTKTRTKCKDCPPDKGVLSLQNTAGWSEIAIMYQIRIAQMPSAAPGYLSEWSFGGKQFDGFDSSQCLLKEAKSTYDQFFDDFGYRKPYWTGDVGVLKQAVEQSAAAVPQPPVQLRWYFMEPKSYRFFSKMFLAAQLSIETVFQP